MWYSRSLGCSGQCVVGVGGCRQCKTLLWGCGPGYRFGFGLVCERWEGVLSYSYQLLWSLVWYQ